jgi:hypothetical protein
MPVAIGDVHFSALVDTGSQFSAVSCDAAMRAGLTPVPVQGTIRLPYSGMSVPRDGLARDVAVRAGGRTVHLDLEVFELPYEAIVGIGDLALFGISILGIPTRPPGAPQEEGSAHDFSFEEGPPTLEKKLPPEQRASLMASIRKGPFEVIGKPRGGAYRLRAPGGGLLATRFAPQRLQLVARRPEDDADEDGRTFVVAKVVGHRESEEEPGSLEYRVRWADFGPDDDTWQLPATFNSTKPIRDYWSRIRHSG